MKAIKIQNLNLINFKAIRSLMISFVNDETYVHGDNGVGKTTIFDAFNWLLFGKDSAGRSDFEVKTLDMNGKVIEKIEHEVSADLLIDGLPLKLKRVLREKWVKKKGNTTAEFTGNETEYYWNEAPVQQKEYMKNISELLDEQIFKLITSPSAFNNLDWKVRREILSSMVTITEDEIIGQNLAFKKLMENIKGHKSIEEYKKMKSASIKKAKEDLKNIPTRIDEVTRNKPEAKDFNSLRESLNVKNAVLIDIDGQIQNKMQAVDAVVKRRNDHTLTVSSIKNKITALENSIKNEADKQVNTNSFEYDKSKQLLAGHESSLKTALNALEILNSNIQYKNAEITEYQRQMDQRRNEWAVINARVFEFDANECKCPTCKRDFETNDIEAKKAELLNNFNTSKANDLATVSGFGKSLKESKEKAEAHVLDLQTQRQQKEATITQIKAEIEKITKIVDSLKPNPAVADQKAEMIYESMLSNNVDLITLKKELAELEAVVIETPSVDNTELLARKEEIKKEIDLIKVELSVENAIKNAEDRIKALIEEEGTLAQQVANVENEIMIADEYSKAKIDALETKINQKFLFVKFKMFETQINGGETECCEATIKGVPFSDANTASKINAGMDIINTLSDFYQVSAPIFIDNRESIVNVVPTHSQLINLVVSESDKVLRVA